MLLHRPTSFALIATAVALSASAEPARADVYYETTYLPTTSILSVPSTTIYPTSYVLPTSSLITTGSVYVPTSTSYVTTSYRYRPRRYVERTTYVAPPTYYSLAPTTYLRPTTYVLPTTYLSSSILPTTYVSSSIVEPTSYLIDTALVTTSASVCCETAPASEPVRATPQPTSKSNREPITSQPSAERRPSGGPSNDEPVSSEVKPPVAAPVPPVTSGPKPPADPTTPPTAPAYDGTKPGAEIQMPPPGSTGANPGEMTSYNTRRPAFGNVPDVRNILKGKVISYETSQPVEAVTVIVSNRTGRFVDRTAMSDADGEFKLSLPDGDWTVKVQMPSGSILAVGQDFVTASAGRVTDGSGRGVKEFLIRR